MAVMKYGNPICEGDSIALSTNLGTMTVPKNIWKESMRSELSNAVFEKFLSFLKRKLKHFQTVRFLMNFIQNCAILAVH